MTELGTLVFYIIQKAHNCWVIQADAMMADKNIHLELEDVPDFLMDEKEIRQMVINLD